MSRSGASVAAATLAAMGALAFAAACASTPTGNNCGSGGTPPSLVGTYSLLSYTLGTTTVNSPAASGQLRFYAFAYGVNLSLPSGTGVNQPSSDSGTYNIVGTTCLQEFSVMGNPNFSGSFQLRADSTFHVSGTTGSQVAASLWKRTP
jgi:hypothetical protein